MIRVQAVDEATKRNESIAAIKDRLKTLGEVGINLAESLVNGEGLDALRRTLNVWGVIAERLGTNSDWFSINLNIPVELSSGFFMSGSRSRGSQ